MKSKIIYSLPVRDSDFLVAHSDSRVHRVDNKLEHAVDFPLPEGTPILATADGVITAVYMESTEGGMDEKFISNVNLYTNRICIKHSDFESSWSAHLLYKSEKVKVGDIVKRGDIIALSGNTGFSTTPHLHFHVQTDVVNEQGEYTWTTLEINWDKPFEIFRK